jgi:4-amino-4-deoxy-L-arabinose transferase-like glycosyltransferase
MKIRDSFSSWFRQSGWAIMLIALIQFGLHLWTNAHDNFFRDELYYMAAAQHLSAGYVEFPPFVALVAGFSRAILGSSVLALRLFPAVAGAAIVLLTAGMAAELGGGLLTQVLAAVTIAVGPVFIGSSGLLTMDIFDQLWWTLAAWILVRMIKRQQPRLWLAFGLIAGIGLLTKLTMGFFVIALLLGLLLSEQRRLLFNRWLLLGGAIALVIFSPYLIWQIQHGLPVVEYTRSYAAGKTYHQDTPLEFLGEQVVAINPLAVPLWLAGLYFLFFSAAGRPYRTFGWAYLALYLFFMAVKTKFYWLSPAYPMLFAGGAYAIQLLVEQRPRLARLQMPYMIILAACGLLLVPFAIPILPLGAFIRYSQSATLPQNFADRYGWREMVTEVKTVYDTLTPQEKSEACIFTANYGEAGAIDFYGPALGLPRAISGHNSYFVWGPQGCTGQVLITVNVPLQDLASGFESVEPAGKTACTYCMPYENEAPIIIARGLKGNLDEAWGKVKVFE